MPAPMTTTFADDGNALDPESLTVHSHEDEDRADHRVNSEQVMKLLEGRIARYKHPKEVIVVEALPKTALGKIRKEDVRQMATHARSHQST